jgi:hypothetical protein
MPAKRGQTDAYDGDGNRVSEKFRFVGSSKKGLEPDDSFLLFR